MAERRGHGIELNRPVARAFMAGGTLHGLLQRHDVWHNLNRIRVAKGAAGAFGEGAGAADVLQADEAKIAALGRLVGGRAPEVELLKGAPTSAARPSSGTASVLAVPRACHRTLETMAPPDTAAIHASDTTPADAIKTCPW